MVCGHRSVPASFLNKPEFRSCSNNPRYPTKAARVLFSENNNCNDLDLHFGKLPSATLDSRGAVQPDALSFPALARLDKLGENYVPQRTLPDFMFDLIFMFISPLSILVACPPDFDRF